MCSWLDYHVSNVLRGSHLEAPDVLLPLPGDMHFDHPLKVLSGFSTA